MLPLTIIVSKIEIYSKENFQAYTFNINDTYLCSLSNKLNLQFKF